MHGAEFRFFGADLLIFPLPGADFGIFGADRLVFPPFGAYLRDFGAEWQVFPPSGAEFGIFGAAGPPGRAYPHFFWGGYVQKWPKTHIPSLIRRRVCTGEGEIIRLIYRGCAGAGGDARRVKKVGTILSKFVPEVARGSACLASCLSARDLSRPFEKIVPDF